MRKILNWVCVTGWGLILAQSIYMWANHIPVEPWLYTMAVSCVLVDSWADLWEDKK